MELLNRENVKASFEQIIAKYGADHKYVRQTERGDIGCFYTRTDEAGNYVPACIIGQVVNLLVPEAIQIVGELEDKSGSSTGAESLVTGAWVGLADSDGNTPKEAFTLVENEEDELFISALTYAQAAQDGGMSWGEAYGAYLDRLNDPDAAKWV